MNASAVNATMQEVRQLLENVNMSITAGNWLAAYDALRSVESKLSDVEGTLSQLGTGWLKLEGNTPIILGGAAVAVAALFAGLYYFQRKGVIKLKIPELKIPGIKKKPVQEKKSVQVGPSVSGKISETIKKTESPYSPRHLSRKLGEALERLGKRMEQADKQK